MKINSRRRYTAESMARLVTGDSVRAVIRRTQETIEGLRPLPTSFISLLGLSIHLANLRSRCHPWLLEACEQLEASGRSQKAIELYESCVRDGVRSNLTNLVTTRPKLWRAQRMKNALGGGGGLAGRVRSLMTPIDVTIADRLGRGDAIAGWDRAWQMAQEGRGGGIRSLRSVVLKQQIIDWARFELAIIEEEIKSGSAASSRAYRMLVVGYLRSSGICDPEVTEHDVFFGWKRLVWAHIKTLLDAFVPDELA